MANAIYPKAKKAFQAGLIDLTAVNVRAIMVDGADYTYSATHEFLSDVPAGARVAVSGNLSSKALGDDGSFDSADPSLVGVSGDPTEILILYVHTGTDGTSRLLAYYDNAEVAATPDGGNFNVLVPSGGWWTL